MRVLSVPAETISFNGTFPAVSNPARTPLSLWEVEVPVLVQVSETWMRSVPRVLV